MNDVNVRITKDTHKKLKMLAAKYEMSMKQIIALLAMSKFPIKVAKDLNDAKLRKELIKMGETF